MSARILLGAMLLAACSPATFRGATSADMAECRLVARTVTGAYSFSGSFRATYEDCMLAKGYEAESEPKPQPKRCEEQGWCQ